MPGEDIKIYVLCAVLTFFFMMNQMLFRKFHEKERYSMLDEILYVLFLCVFPFFNMPACLLGLIINIFIGIELLKNTFKYGIGYQKLVRYHCLDCNSRFKRLGEYWGDGVYSKTYQACPCCRSTQFQKESKCLTRKQAKERKKRLQPN